MKKLSLPSGDTKGGSNQYAPRGVTRSAHMCQGGEGETESINAGHARTRAAKNHLTDHGDQGMRGGGSHS